MLAAKAAPPTQRDALIEQVRELLRRTDEVRLAGGAIAISDAPLAARLSPETIDRSLADLEAEIATADVVASRRLDPTVADAKLQQALRERAQAAEALPFAAIVAELARRAIGWLYDLIGRPSQAVLEDLEIALGLALALVLALVLGRGVRERIRRETAVVAAASAARERPEDHLRAADEAVRAGRFRDAIHALYQYALSSLAASEAIRYDPALTDRELLARAAALAHAEQLRALVELHERVWFGLRHADVDLATRARALAVEAGR